MSAVPAVFDCCMARRRDESPLDVLFDALALLFRHVPPWVSIVVAIIGFFLIVSIFPSFTTGMFAGLQPLKFFFGGLFAFICLMAGLKGWMVRRDLATGASTKCPVCSSGMILKRARRGVHAGGQFWGCSRYPSCKGIRNIG